MSPVSLCVSGTLNTHDDDEEEEDDDDSMMMMMLMMINDDVDDNDDDWWAEGCDAVTAERPADSLSKDDASPFIEFGDDDEDFDVDEARRRQDEEFHFSSMMKQAATDSKHRESSQGFSLSLFLVVTESLQKVVVHFCM